MIVMMALEAAGIEFLKSWTASREIAGEVTKRRHCRSRVQRWKMTDYERIFAGWHERNTKPR